MHQTKTADYGIESLVFQVKLFGIHDAVVILVSPSCCTARAAILTISAEISVARKEPSGPTVLAASKLERFTLRRAARPQGVRLDLPSGA